MSCGDRPHPDVTSIDEMTMQVLEQQRAQELDRRRREVAKAQREAMDAWARLGVDATDLQHRRVPTAVLAELSMLVKRVKFLGLDIPAPRFPSTDPRRLLLELLRDGVHGATCRSGPMLLALLFDERDALYQLQFAAAVKGLVVAAKHPKTLREAVEALSAGGS